MILGICSQPEILEVLNLVKIIVGGICIIVPIILIVFISKDYLKSISDSDALANVHRSLITRAIAAIVIFMIPTFIRVILYVADFAGAEVYDCLDKANAVDIDIAYSNKASDYLNKTKDSLNRTDYDNAKISASKVDDVNKRNDLLEELEKLEEYVDLKDKIGKLKENFDEEKFNEYRDKVENINDEEIKSILKKELDNAQKGKDVGDANAPIITSITNDGVIVKINVNKKSSNISGYYFSYTNKRPDKNKGGYLATGNQNIEVVRLPGTTYVWVEDTSGKISSAKTITLGNNILPQTLNSYTVLKGKSLREYISEKGGSIDELNKLVARSVRAAGLYTKEGAATAAVSLQMVLIQKYKIKIPYWMGGKTQAYGASGIWGTFRDNPTYPGYKYYGMDCDGFVNWSYFNAGVVYKSMTANHYFLWPDSNNVSFSKENGDVGDIIKRPQTNGQIGHVAIIIGKTNDSFIVAEAYGDANGNVINFYPYDVKRNYVIIKGERLFEKYNVISSSEYPSGF